MELYQNSSNKRLIILVSILTSLSVTLAFNLVSYGLPVSGLEPLEPSSYDPNRGPTITSISPVSEKLGIGFVLIVNGTNFLSTSVINLDGNPQSTSYNSPTELQVAFPELYQLLTVGGHEITVTNPAPDGGTSNAVTLTINQGSTITNISPASARQNGPVTLITVNGTGFLNSSVVRYNGVNLSTVYFSGGATQASYLVATASSSNLLRVAGQYNIRVFNPPGQFGGYSNAVTFTVTP